MPVTNVDGLIENRVKAIQEYHKRCGLPRAELDVSGGADSAAMAGLLVLALGPDNCTFVHSRIETDPEQTARATALIGGLGARLIDIDLTPMFKMLVYKMEAQIGAAVYTHTLAQSDIPTAMTETEAVLTDIQDRLLDDPTILGSIKSCLRAPIGRGFNRLMGGGIRHGTGNECEDRFLRYYQKGGDGEVDTNPLEMLSKSEVYQLLWGLAQRFPEAAEAFRACIQCHPSADLWGPDTLPQLDETELQKWLGVNFTYGKVNPETGETLSFGTIERVSRFLDREASHLMPARLLVQDCMQGSKIETLLFSDFEVPWERCIAEAQQSKLFDGFTREQISSLLNAARRAEHTTRHKSNTNIPMLGTRQDLIAQNILSNDLV